MGNQLARIVRGKGGKGSNEDSNNKKKAKNKASMRKKQQALEEELLQQQLLAFALQHQKAQIRLERASSHRNATGLVPSFPEKGLPRSASARPRSSSDTIVPPTVLLNGAKDGAGAEVMANLETKHFVLVHGGGNGAWCWYKVIALLEKSGFKATTIDLTGSGIDRTDPNTITSLAQYVAPLMSFMEGLPESEKVILVAHDFGGACISYVMEHFPDKIAKAVFVSAAMIINGQRGFDVFSPEVMTADDLLRKAQKFIYANPASSVPTAIEFDRTFLKELFFNESPAKDIALAAVSLRPIPFAPVSEKLVLTEKNYGKVRRFFVETTEDNALTPALQNRITELNPPERVYKVKGGDHSPFFSKPMLLVKTFQEIARLEKDKS